MRRDGIGRIAADQHGSLLVEHAKSKIAARPAAQMEPDLGLGPLRIAAMFPDNPQELVNLLRRNPSTS
jgi:hypothetical protein